MYRYVVFGLALLLGACGPAGTPTPADAPPSVDSFTVSPNPAARGEDVRFTWTVSGAPLACSLSYGDGETSELSAADCAAEGGQTYSYPEAGVYDASFVAAGTAGEDSRVVSVSVTAPGAPQPGEGTTFIGLMALPRNSLARFTYVSPDTEEVLSATVTPVTNTGGDLLMLDKGPDGVLYGLSEEGDDVVVYTVDPDTGRATRRSVVSLPTGYGLSFQSWGDIDDEGIFWVFSSGSRGYYRIDLAAGTAEIYAYPSFAPDDTFAARGVVKVQGFAFTGDGSALYIDGLGGDRRPVVAIESPAGSGSLRSLGLLNAPETDQMAAFEIVNGVGYTGRSFNFYEVDVDRDSPTVGSATPAADLQEQLLDFTPLDD